MKVPREILSCVLISGCILAALAYFDFAPHNERLSYLPSDLQEMGATREATLRTAVTGLAAGQPSAGTQSQRSCTTDLQDAREVLARSGEPHGDPSLKATAVVENASCHAGSPPHRAGDAPP